MNWRVIFGFVLLFPLFSVVAGLTGLVLYTFAVRVWNEPIYLAFAIFIASTVGGVHLLATAMDRQDD